MKKMCGLFVVVVLAVMTGCAGGGQEMEIHRPPAPPESGTLHFVLHLEDDVPLEQVEGGELTIYDHSGDRVGEPTPTLHREFSLVEGTRRMEAEFALFTGEDFTADWWVRGLEDPPVGMDSFQIQAGEVTTLEYRYSSQW